MANGILALFGVSLAAAIGEMLLPGAESAGSRRALRTLVALTVLLLILRPVMGFVANKEAVLEGSIDVLEQDAEAFESLLSDAVSRRARTELEGGIASLVAEQFKLEGDTLAVTVTLDGEGEPSRVEIRLSGKALLLDPDEIEQFVKQYLSCEVEVR